MRQPHIAGEKMFVDFAGQTVPIVDPKTGSVSQAQLFVAVLGASNYTYAEACPSQELEHWLGAHVRALEWFGGVPKVFVPDNLKSGIQRACRYEPDINPAYHELATHYGAVVIPARTRKARDKAKVEVGVLVVERSVLAALRKRTFFSLGEAQAAIREAVCALNARPFKRLAGSRKSRFETLERPALIPLPADRYEYGTWMKTRVQEHYHLEVSGNYYSVPAELFGQMVEARVTAQTLEVFFKGRRVASHALCHGSGQLATNPLHQPEAHRRLAEWGTEKAEAWAVGIGPSMVRFVQRVVASKGHPEQARRACLGIVRLGRDYDRERLESAAARALAVGSISYRSLQAILRYGLDRVAIQRAELAGVGTHGNIRGPEYYRSAEVAPC
jgi:transposase